MGLNCWVWWQGLQGWGALPRMPLRNSSEGSRLEWGHPGGTAATSGHSKDILGELGLVEEWSRLGQAKSSEAANSSGRTNEKGGGADRNHCTHTTYSLLCCLLPKVLCWTDRKCLMERKETREVRLGKGKGVWLKLSLGKEEDEFPSVFAELLSVLFFFKLQKQ